MPHIRPSPPAAFIGLPRFRTSLRDVHVAAKLAKAARGQNHRCLQDIDNIVCVPISSSPSSLLPRGQPTRPLHHECLSNGSHGCLVETAFDTPLQRKHQVPHQRLHNLVPPTPNPDIARRLPDSLCRAHQSHTQCNRRAEGRFSTPRSAQKVRHRTERWRGDGAEEGRTEP